MAKGRIWSKEDEKFLREHYSSMENGELMNILFRSEKSIQAKANALRVLKERKDICKYSMIAIKIGDEFLDYVDMEQGMKGFLSMLKRQAHNIRPAIRRGQKFTIEPA